MKPASGRASKRTVEVTIRKLAASDVPAVLAILRESPEAAAWSQESLLQLASAESLAWVAELNGAVAGFLIGRIAADEFEILNMAVSKAHRRSGIGSYRPGGDDQILNAVDHISRRRGSTGERQLSLPQ